MVFAAFSLERDVGLVVVRADEVGRVRADAAGGEEDLTEALELPEVGDGQLRVGDPHRLERAEDGTAVVGVHGHRQRGRVRQDQVGGVHVVVADTDVVRGHLGDGAARAGRTLTGDAVDVDEVTDLAVEEGVRVEDEQPLGGGVVVVAVVLDRLDEEPAQTLVLR
jgi:hypothetical protein